MVGSLNCLQEAKASTNYFDISFSTPVDCKQKEEGVWLYVEQNTSKKPCAPEWQKIYHLAKLGRINILVKQQMQVYLKIWMFLV